MAQTKITSTGMQNNYGRYQEAAKVGRTRKPYGDARRD